jgi:arylsulfatase A-like enzyme
MDDSRPNVLFIICDDLNNAIASMGRVPFAPAPNLQALMERGTRFVNAQSNCPVSLPSRCSLLSGIYPHASGHYTLWDRWRTQRYIHTTVAPHHPYADTALLGNAVMLPKHFRDNGYTTLGVGKVAHEGMTDPDWWDDYALGPDYGPFLWDTVRGRQQEHPDRLWLYEGDPLCSYVERYRGVDRFFLNDNEFRHHIEMNFGPLPEVFGWPGAEIRTQAGQGFRYRDDDHRDRLPDERAADWAVDRLSHLGPEPFLLAVGFMKPHTPLNAPQRFFERFPLSEIELPTVLEGDCEDCARAHIEHRPYGFLFHDMVLKGGEPMWRRWLQAYLACIAFMDEQLGRILRALDESGRADNTIIVFTSDNGYHMGEKGFIFKDTLWEESDQVPLIVSTPSQATRGGTCTHPVSLIDLYPTLTDLCGLPMDPHAATHGHPLQGHSLRPFLDDPQTDAWSGPPVALTSVRGDTGIHHSVRSRDCRYTLCQNGGEELYDHRRDPGEWENLAGQRSCTELKAALRHELMQLIWGQQ